MPNLTHLPNLWMGPGEWLGECLRLLNKATDDEPSEAARVPGDWRFDWTHHSEPLTPARRLKQGHGFE